MPEMTPLGNTIIPPNPNQGLQTLSSLIGLRQQKQALQTGAYEQQTALATSQQAQQQNKELQAAQNLAVNGAKSGNYTNTDGTLDRQKMADDITAVAPTYGQHIASSLLSQANEIVANAQAQQSLSRSQQEQMGATFGSLATKSDLTPSDFVDSLNGLTDQNKSPQFKRMAMSMLTHLPSNATPQQLQEIARRWSIASTGSESATSQTNPSVALVQGKKGLVPTNLNPQAPGGIQPAGPTQAQGVAPGAQPVVDAYGRISVFNPQGNTTTPIGTGTTGTKPSSFTQPVPQQAQIEQEVEGTRKADADYGVNRHVNEQLLRLSASTDTGPGTQTWHHALGAIAGPGGGNNVADYQTIGAYLDRQAAMSTRQMGLPDTNAGLATAASLSGTTSYQPKALQTKVKLTDALVEGAHQYRQGLDKVVGTGANQDLSKYQAYRSAWTANFDPTVFLLENAHKRGDKAETSSILNSLSPEQAKALQQKRRNLNALANGQLQ